MKCLHTLRWGQTLLGMTKIVVGCFLSFLIPFKTNLHQWQKQLLKVIIIFKKSEFLFLLAFLSNASRLGTNSLLNRLYLQYNAVLTSNNINAERSLVTYQVLNCGSVSPGVTHTQKERERVSLMVMKHTFVPSRDSILLPSYISY